MELTTRFSGSGAFLEIRTDETETTVFTGVNDPSKLIENLISVIEDLCKLIDKEFNYEIKDEE